MRTASHRRLDRVLVGAGAVAVGGAGLFGALTGDSERIDGYFTTATVSADGRADIVEVIDYDFGSETGRHGIYRDVPGLETTDRVVVASPSAPDEFILLSQGRSSTLDADGEVRFDPVTRIRIGDPNATVASRHRYRIDYSLPDLVRGDVVAWNAVGTEWEVGLNDIEAHLVTPFAVTDVACSVGRTGTVGGCTATEIEPGHLVVTVDSLDSGEGVTIAGDVGAPVAAPAPPSPPTDTPPDPGAGVAVPAGVAAVAALVAGVPTSIWARRAGREQTAAGGGAAAAYADGAATETVELIDEADLHDLATTEFAPPEGLDPAHGGVVHDEGVSDDHKIAWLIDLSTQGAFDLEDTAADKPTLVWRGGAGTDNAVLAKMFKGRPRVELGGYDKDFALGWKQLDRELNEWMDDSNLWDVAAKGRRSTATVLGGLLALIGLVGTFGAAWLSGRVGAAALAIVAVAGAAAGVGITLLIRNWELRVRTTQGTAAWLRLESFRRFLAESEAHHVDWAAEHGILREYTAWAVALGEIDRWSANVAASSVGRDPQYYGMTHMALVAPSLRSATSSAATAPRSSGGGFGGGGFGGGGVGGGGGGGGGGSW